MTAQNGAYQYDLCRGLLGHGWEPRGGIEHQGSGRSATLTVTVYCKRCTTTKHIVVTASHGRIEGNSYAYPKDYRVPGTGRSRDAFRARAVTALDHK